MIKWKSVWVDWDVPQGQEILDRIYFWVYVMHLKFQMYHAMSSI